LFIEDNKYTFHLFIADRMRFTRILSLLILCLLFSDGRAQEIGLQLYSLRNQFKEDAAGTMAKVKEMGIRHVEMNGTYGLSFPEFIKLLAVNGLNVVSYTADFEKLEKFPQVVADEARSYGAKFIVCAGIPHAGESPTKEDVDKAVAILNHSGKIAARNGMLLCYQPAGYEFNKYENKTLFDYLVDTLDSRFVHFEMDVFWIKQAGQDPVTLLRKYPTRFILLQLKDRKTGTAITSNGKADTDSNVVLGSGDVGIKRVIETARELGIQHVFIEDESSRAIKQIPKSLAYLRTINEKDTAKK
jgi:sugar phosphate isomerase/epimerase